MKARISSSSCVGRDELLAARRVDPVVAGVRRRGRRDPHVDLGRPGRLQEPHELLRRRPADDGVVDEDDPLAADDGPDGVQLHLDAEVPDRLLRLDEGPPDVVVPHEPHAVRDAALLGVAERREDPRVGDGDDDVRRDRRARARAAARRRGATRRPTCGRRSSRGGRSRRARRRRRPSAAPSRSDDEATPPASRMTISPGSTSRSGSASMRSKAHVSEATSQASPRRPIVSGRKPCGSRAARTFSPARRTIE